MACIARHLAVALQWHRTDFGRVLALKPGFAVAVARFTLWVVHGSMAIVAIFALLRQPVPMVGWEFSNPVLLALGLFFIGAPLATYLVKLLVAGVFGTAGLAAGSVGRSRPPRARPKGEGRPAAPQSYSTSSANRSNTGSTSHQQEPTLGEYGYLDAESEIGLVRVEDFRDALNAVLRAEFGSRSRIEGLARLQPFVAPTPGQRDARGRLVTRVAVEFEGTKVGYLPDEVALAVVHNLRRFQAESGLDVFCPLSIAAGTVSERGQPGEPTVTVRLGGRRAHAAAIVVRSH